MQIYPALDLRNNRVVRLHQGKFDQETCYSDDPSTVVKDFIAAGATWLHVVDLDAAKNPKQNQFALISELIKNFTIKVQIGGGIRTREQVKKYLDGGAARVIIGSQAIKKSEEVIQWMEEFGARHFVLALDVECINDNAFVSVQGWQQRSNVELLDVLETYKGVNLSHVLCTDIARDGTMSGPNFDLYVNIMRRYPSLQLQASGGIGNLGDIEKLRGLSISGAIVGKALYEKKFTLRAALEN